VSGRFPRSVFDEGDEPDARFTLANERTFLAWVRTALALMAGAIAVHAPGLELDVWARTAVSLVLLAVAALAIGQAWRRWHLVERAIRTGQPLPGFAGPATVTAALVGLIVAVAVGVLVVALR
jgi:putative membrane protein